MWSQFTSEWQSHFTQTSQLLEKFQHLAQTLTYSRSDELKLPRERLTEGQNKVRPCLCDVRWENHTHTHTRRHFNVSLKSVTVNPVSCLLPDMRTKGSRSADAAAHVCSQYVAWLFEEPLQIISNAASVCERQKTDLLWFPDGGGLIVCFYIHCRVKMFRTELS